MRKQIENILLHALTNRNAKVGTKTELEERYKQILPPPIKVKLTENEVYSINKVWGKLGKKIDFRYWQLYKKLGMFNAFMVPENLYVGYIIRTLNPLKLSKCLQNKNHYPLLFRELKQPEVVVNCIRGVWYNAGMEVLDSKDATRIFADVDECIIKPVSESCSGHGIKRVKIDGRTDYQTLFDSYGGNFICQKIVKQYSKTDDINASSLNTFRINTFNVNGLITVEDMIFRHGQQGSVVDNGHGGGVCCGINADGTLSGWGYDAKMKRHTVAPNGVPYMDIKLPEVKILMDFAVNAHRLYLPAMGQVAWDLALDENCEPILIEVNLGWPGVIFDQMANGKPLFGSRTEEIIEYVADNMKYLQWKDFLGNWN